MLESLFFPKSIAIIGASSNPQKIGHSIAKNILSNGYSGKVYFINIHKEKILGKASYDSIIKISGAIDLAIIVIPSLAVPDVLEECGKKGVKNVIIISAGFSEIGDAGKELEDRISSIAIKYQIQLLGPNCLGFLNSKNNLNASFADGMIMKGDAAFFSQSGALCSAMLDWAKKMDIGFSKFISVGNKTVIDEASILKYLLEDKATKVVLGYLEGFKRGKQFIETAKKNSKKPVIIMKSGATQAGMKAASSHTGAMAQDDDVIDAAVLDTNIIRAKTIEEFFHLSLLFSWQPRLNGNKIAIVTNAGGLAVISADAISQSNLALADFSNATKASLKKILPSEATIGNPLDIIGDADAQRYRNAISCVLADKNVDGIIVLLTPQTVTDIPKTAENIAECFKNSKKPVIASFLGGEKTGEGVSILEKNKIPCFDFPEVAVKAFDAMARSIRKTVKSEGNETMKYKKICIKPEIYRNIRESIYVLKNKDILTLGFDGGKDIMQKYEIPFIGTVTVQNENDVALKLGSLSFPLVAKIDSPQVIHKTDAGGVKINLRNPEDAKAAYREIIKNVKNRFPKAEIRGVVFQEMVRDSLEVIVGAKRDEQFGPVILFGLGGTVVEVFKDVSMRLAPVSLSQAKKMITEVKFYPVLRGIRGQAGYDMDAIADVINKISQIMIDFEEIKEIDLNPIMVMRENKGLKAVDVRIIF